MLVDNISTSVRGHAIKGDGSLLAIIVVVDNGEDDDEEVVDDDDDNDDKMLNSFSSRSTRASDMEGSHSTSAESNPSMRSPRTDDKQHDWNASSAES